MMTMPVRGAATVPVVLILCWCGILSEGYDVGVTGAILPALATDSAWHLSPLQLGALGSWALAGMFFGGLFAGTLSDLWGRKRMFVLCLALFSLTMVGLVWSPTPEWFVAFRFIGGLGLGGIIPVAAALSVEYSATGRRSANYGWMYSGYSMGILVAACTAAMLLPAMGWRGVVAVGVLPLLLIPVVLRYLPESLEQLVASGQIERAAFLAARLGRPVPQRALRTTAKLGAGQAIGALFAPGRRRATACFWVALFMGMLLVYGLGNWLPQIMRRSGYDLGPSLMFLAVFAIASAVGGVLLGEAADRRGVRIIVSASFAIGAVALVALGVKGSMLLTYALVAVAGYGSISTSLILTGFVAGYYPPEVRATAVGWAMSFARLGAVCGPLIGGVLQQMQVGAEWNFRAFAIAAAIAAIAVFLVPGGRREAPIGAVVGAGA
jgi:AAHS family benzoate transporter-like MFS transporter